MSKGIQGALLRHLGAREHDTTVIAAEMVSPGMRRIRFHAPTAFDDIVCTPGTYVRGWFPDDKGREHQRGYTLIDIDTEAREYAIDFLIHDPAGPAGDWAAQARVGDHLVVSPFGVRPFEVPEPEPQGYLLIADAAGIPAVREMAAAIPADIPVEIYLGQYRKEDREIPLGARENSRVHWVVMHTETALADALETRDWQGWKAIVIAESSAGRHCRKRLQQQAGFPRSEISGQAYWKAGKEMGVSRELSAEDAAADPAAETALSANAAPTETTPATAAAATTPEGAPTETSPEGAPGASTPGAAPAENTSGAAPTWNTHRGRELLAPVRPALWIAGIAELAITVLQLLPYLFLVEIARTLLENGTGSKTVAHITHTGVVFLIVFGLGALLSSTSVVLMHIVDARFTHALRRRLIHHLTRLPLQWFSSRGRARVAATVADDTLALHALVTHAVPATVSAVAAPLIALGYLFFLDWRIALVLLIPLLAAVWLMYVMIYRSYDAAVAAPKRARRLDERARAYVEAHDVVATFPHTANFYRAELRGYLTFLRTWQLPLADLKTAFTISTRPVTLLLVIAVVATPLVLSGSVTIPTALTFLFIGTTFASSLLGLGYQLQEVRAGLDAANRVAAVMCETPLPEVDHSETLSGTLDVDISHLSYGYHARTRVLQDISLHIPAGSRCALVGPSGAGKSTLAALLARFADPDSGSIHIGGVDLRALTVKDLYRTVGFVFQEVELLRGSVRDNIALGRPDATRDEVIAAAKAAQIHTRIMRLPEGYDTVITARTGLSGGELQRLTIARLFLANPPVVVLDEATAFADPASEAAVHRALHELTRNRTVIMIAHRLETIVDYDMIVYLENGQVREQGTHAELLDRGAHYRRLWEARQ